MSRHLIFYFLAIGGIIAASFLLQQDVLLNKQNAEENNTIYIESEADERKQEANVSVFSPKSLEELSEHEQHVAMSEDTGLLLVGDLLIIKPADPHIRYEFIRQERTEEELKVIVRPVPDSSPDSTPLIGKLKMEGFLPIGIYDMEGHFLQ